ncbi:MAG: ABC transporter substrate-binding protein [Caldilineaceae bacterium]|nr:ABC transporter substrate-binding protein [Caldilineaceae bacterium]
MSKTIFSARARSLMVFGLLPILCALLAGCGRDRDSEILFEAEGPPLTLSYVSPSFSSVAATEQVAIDRFLERAPGIELDRQPMRGDAADYLLDSPPPDVMLLWDGLLLRGAAEQGLLSDLADVWSENNLAESFGDQFHDLSRIEGSPRLVPAGFSWAGIYYNVEVFDRYGLSPPADWEAFIRICDTLLANGETPLSLAGQNSFVSSFWFDYLSMRLNGPEFHAELMAGRVSYRDERVARVWELWLSMLERGYFIETPGSTSDLSSMTALVRGDSANPLNREKAVMVLAPHFSAGELPPAFATELDFFQFPPIDASVATGEVSVVFGYVVPAGALNPVAAGVFVGYMGSTEAQELQLRQMGEDDGNAGYVPVHQGLDDELLSEAAVKGGQIVRGADAIRPPLSLVIPDEMQRGFTSVLRRLFLKTGTRIRVEEIQTILEDAREDAIQGGAYPP